VKFFILAGGYGRRAEPLSRFKPKPAFPLNGIPLIALLLRQLRTQGCRQGFINLHHLAEQVVAAVGSRKGIRFIEEKELSGSRVLTRALPGISEWLLVVNGDTFLEIPLQELRRKATDPGVDGVLLARPDRTGGYGRLHCLEDEFLMSTAPGASPCGEGLMYAGAALFRKRAVEKIEGANFFSSIQEHRLRFKIALYGGIWLDLGTPAAYFQANWQYMAHCAERCPNALSRQVTISPHARVVRSVLWEQTRIGPGVDMSECIVTGGIELEHASYSGQVVSPQGIFPLR
jgi:NDP-sugar pyrophosphorylase family protein